MATARDRGIEYMRKVYEESQQFAVALLRENERLRRLHAELEEENARQAAALAVPPCAAELEDVEASHRERLEAIEAENRGLSQQFEALQQQTANLLNLYVATYRLHGTLDREEVLAALQEIIANMVGSEELAIFELNDDSGMLSLVASAGIDEDRYRVVPVDAGAIGHAGRTGEIYLGGNATGSENSDEQVTASIPLTANGRVMGVIAIFRLLGQKSGLEPHDLELFNLLKTHAGTALYCTELHAEHGARR